MHSVYRTVVLTLGKICSHWLPLTTKLSFCHYDSKFVWMIFKYPNKIEHLCYDHVPTAGMQLANFICKLFYSTIGIIATVI